MAVTIRKNDIRAAKLYLLGFACRALPVLLFLPVVGMSPLVYGGTFGVTLLVQAALGAGVWAGYRWVKLLLVTAVTWQVAMQLLKLVGSSNPRGAILLELLALGLEVGAAVIILKDLFTRAPAEKTAV
ncbi:hypothetical protein MTX78_24835 (plasmid) [Hymenobacter tibetensis]|uniref:Uncharacterized protein n=1 Tax=Hymenobacter tibetensis TaxID=497967 RepID=A0ABY4D5K9_9BACT|nr:hypothetical protein [Hymenobacter tibetensis]UOG77638.1 hypothetical protein MTX78_24835 [Hymenobacter tibetensis]